MANEIDLDFSHGQNLYFLVWSRISQVWNTNTLAFEAYLTANYANYAIAMTELGTASGHYAGTFPPAIPAGVYGIGAHAQAGGSPAETDAPVAAGDFQWNGVAEFPLSDLVTSGQVAGLFPVKLARAWQVKNYPIYLKSSVDHVTPFTSGVVSGQISRDGGGFTALQSGAFSEVGLGWYNLQALTSGDLAANTVALMFTANGISGFSADPLPVGYVLQRSSGSA